MFLIKSLLLLVVLTSAILHMLDKSLLLNQLESLLEF